MVRLRLSDPGRRNVPPLAALAVAMALACTSSPGDGDATDAPPDPGDVAADVPADDTAAADDGDDAPETTGPPPPLRWSSPENLTDTRAASHILFNRGYSVAVGPGGTVHAVWRDVYAEAAGVVDAQVVHRRRVGGAWEPPQTLTAVVPGAGCPKLAVSGTHVYVAWHVYDPDPAGADDVLLSVSDADGAPGTFAAPRTLATDAAVTALNPLQDDSTQVAVAARDAVVHVVWSDERTVAACGGPVPEIYLVTSLDHGATWSDVRPVSSLDCRSSWTPSVAVAGSIVHAAWTDERHDDPDCGLTGGLCREEEYYRRLADDGATPDPLEVRLTHDAPGSPFESWAPSIGAWGGQVHVAWFDRSGGDDFEIYHARSTDDGRGWDEPARRLSAHAPGCRSATPSLAGAGDAVHVVWMEVCGDTASTARHAWSNDRGVSWSDASDVGSGTSVFAVYPSVALGAVEVHVVWTDQWDVFHATAAP